MEIKNKDYFDYFYYEIKNFINSKNYRKIYAIYKTWNKELSYNMFKQYFLNKINNAWLIKEFMNYMFSWYLWNNLLYYLYNEWNTDFIDFLKDFFKSNDSLFFYIETKNNNIFSDLVMLYKNKIYNILDDNIINKIKNDFKIYSSLSKNEENLIFSYKFISNENFKDIMFYKYFNKSFLSWNKFIADNLTKLLENRKKVILETVLKDLYNSNFDFKEILDKFLIRYEDFKYKNSFRDALDYYNFIVWFFWELIFFLLLLKLRINEELEFNFWFDIWKLLLISLKSFQISINNELNKVELYIYNNLSSLIEKLWVDFFNVYFLTPNLLNKHFFVNSKYLEWLNFINYMSLYSDVLMYIDNIFNISKRVDKKLIYQEINDKMYMIEYLLLKFIFFYQYVIPNLKDNKNIDKNEILSIYLWLFDFKKNIINKEYDVNYDEFLKFYEDKNDIIEELKHYIIDYYKDLKKVEHKKSNIIIQTMLLFIDISINFKNNDLYTNIN